MLSVLFQYTVSVQSNVLVVFPIMQSFVLSLDRLVLLSVPYSASITSVANSVQHVMGPVSTLFLSQDLQSSGVRYCLICFAQPVHDMDQFARQWQFTEEYSFQTPWCMENNHTCLWTSPQKVVDLAGVRSVLPTATMHQGLVCVSAAEERKWVDSHLHFWNVESERMKTLGFPPLGSPSDFCCIMNRVASVLEKNNIVLEQQQQQDKTNSEEMVADHTTTKTTEASMQITKAHMKTEAHMQTPLIPLHTAATQTHIEEKPTLKEDPSSNHEALIQNMKAKHAFRVQQLVRLQNNLQSEIDEWRAKYNEIEGNHAELKGKHAELEDMYRSQESACKTMGIEQQVLHDQCAQLKEAMVQSKKQMVDLEQKSRQDWEKSTRDIQEKCKLLQNGVVKYKQEVEEYKVMYTAKQTELDHIRDKFENLEKKAVTQRRVNDKILEKVERLRKKLLEESTDPDCKTLDALVEHVRGRMDFMRKERVDLQRILKRSAKQPTYDEFEGLDTAFADEYLLSRKEAAASIVKVLQKTNNSSSANDQPTFHKAMEVELEPFEIVHPRFDWGTCRLQGSTSTPAVA